MSCDDARDLIAFQALGEIEPADRALLDLHLAGCPECRQIANEYNTIASRLPLALAGSSPLPPDLKARILEQVGTSVESHTLTSSPHPLTGTQVGGKKPHVSRFTFHSSLFRWAAVAAAAMLIALVVGWNLQLSAALAQERALRSEYASLVEQQEIVLEVVDSPRTVRRLLRSTTGGTAYGKLFTRTDLPEVVVMAARLEAAPAGQAYHLWLTSDGQTRLAGTLNVNQAGFGLIVFEAGRTGPTYQSARVTLQPEGNEPAGTLTLAWEGTQ